jgi:dUTP pyrophosphatase
MHTFFFKKLHPDAKIPFRSMQDDVGHDVSSIEHVVIAPGETRAVATGLTLASHVGDSQDPQEINFIKVEGRSGLALRGIFPVGGIIDPGYRGEIKIILHNSSPNAHTVLAGDRIAQLIVYSARGQGAIAELPADVEATKTDRGESGFGSTGK